MVCLVQDLASDACHVKEKIFTNLGSEGGT